MAISLLAYLGLVGFTFVRSFRSYAWWEFPVVAVLLMVATLVPLAQPVMGATFGFDFRPSALHGALVSLQPLVLPAVMVAGSAPAQIVVTGAQAAAARPVGRGLFWTGFAIAVAWLAVATFLALGGRELTPSALLVSAALLVAVGAAVALLVRRARVPAPPPPESYPKVWGRWLYPLATAVAAVVTLSFAVVILRGVFQVLRQDAVTSAITVAWNAYLDNDPGTIWRSALGAVTLVIAWHLAARNRLAEAVALASFSILVLGDAIGQVANLGFLRDRTTTALGLLAAVIALGAAAVLAVGRRLDRSRAVGVMTVVLLSVLYPHRNLLENPASAALVVAPAVMLVFGLAWRVFTEAQVTCTGSPKYPQPTRVLLYLANTLLAATVVAFVALARAVGTDVDPSVYGELGDTVLGDPLFVAGLVTGLWLLLRPAAQPVQAPQLETVG